MAIGKIIGRVAIKVLPDTSDFREKTANDLRRIEKQLGDLEVDVIPEIDKRTKEKVKGELDAWAKSLNLNVKVDLDLNNTDVLKSMAALEALTKRRNVKIAPELDNGAVAKVAAGLAAMSGLRYTLRLFRNFRQELMNLDMAVPKIGAVSHAVAVLGAWVMGVSGNLFSLSSSIASIGQAGLALPGIFGGLAVGLATTAAALKDFNKQVPQAARYVHELQDTISQNFWDKAAAPIRDLVDTLFPLLNRKLAETSTSLGGFFAAFSNSAIELLIPRLGPMFDNLSESIKISTGFTDAFVGIIAKLGDLGSQYLPRLAAWFGNIATRFDNFLASAEADGRLKGWVEDGITALKQLGSATASLFSIFHSLGQAAEAAGGSTLASLSAGLKDIAAAAASPGFQSGLTDTLAAAYNMMNQIATIAGPAVKAFIVSLAETFQSLAPTIGDTIGTAVAAITSALSQPAVAEGLTAMFEGFNSMVHSLAPAMDPLMQKFAVMGELIGALAANIGKVMAALITSLAPVFVGIVEALLPVINMLGPMLTKAITALGPVFAVLGEKLAGAASALEPMFAALQKLANLLLPVLVPVLKILVTIIGDALIAAINGVTWVIEGLTKIITGVIDVFSGLWDVIAGLFTLDFGRVGDGIAKAFSGLGNIILGALQAALGAVWAWMNGTVLGFFKGFIVKLAGPIAGPLATFFAPLGRAFEAVKPVISKVVDFIKTAFSYISGGGGGSALSRLGEVLIYPFENAALGIKAAFNVIKIVVKTAWSVIRTVIDAGAKVVSTIFQAHVTIWKTIFQTAWTVIKTIFTATFGAIRAFLETSLNGLYFLFQAPWIAVSEFLLATWTTIKTGFMLIWESIRTFLVGILDWFLVRIPLVWAEIKAMTTEAWNAIKAIFTAVWTEIKLVFTTYIAIIKTVVNAAWNAIKSVTSSVWNGIKSVVSSVWNSIKSATSSVLSSIKSTVSSAWNTIKSTASSAWNSVKSTVSSAWSSVKSSVSNGVRDAVNKVKELPGKAKSALGGIGSILINAGKDLIGGFIDGIKSKFGDVKGALGSLTGKLTSWKGPESLDKVLLVGAGHLIIDGLIRGFEDRFTAVRSSLSDLTTDIAGYVGKSMSEQISDALSFAMTGDVAASITTEAAVTGVNLDRRLGGLERHVTSAARSARQETSSTSDAASIQIDNITIPLEDLAQLKDLEEFLELLRVRIRQG